MNIVVLQGNLTKDPEVRVVGTEKKTSVANFTVAVNRYFRKSNGESDKETDFFFCEAWDSGAETIGEIFNKGDSILLEGSLKTDQWEKEGVKHSRVKVRVGRFQKLNRQKKEATAEDGGEQTPAPTETKDEVKAEAKSTAKRGRPAKTETSTQPTEEIPF